MSFVKPLPPSVLWYAIMPFAGGDFFAETLRRGKAARDARVKRASHRALAGRGKFIESSSKV
jgi:hypothetical protein